MFRVCHVFLSVHCSLVFTCWERADLLALLCVICFIVYLLQFWCPGSGVVLDCIDFLSFPSFLLFYEASLDIILCREPRVDQTEQMCRLACIFVVPMQQTQDFSR